MPKPDVNWGLRWWAAIRNSRTRLHRRSQKRTRSLSSSCQITLSLISPNSWGHHRRVSRGHPPSLMWQGCSCQKVPVSSDVTILLLNLNTPQFTRRRRPQCSHGRGRHATTREGGTLTPGPFLFSASCVSAMLRRQMLFTPFPVSWTSCCSWRRRCTERSASLFLSRSINQSIFQVA